ncbi:MAG: hypothetical protein ACMXYE_01520 [Candidatus Woesearchaeota archaeon]
MNPVKTYRNGLLLKSCSELLAKQGIDDHVPLLMKVEAEHGEVPAFLERIADELFHSSNLYSRNEPVQTSFAPVASLGRGNTDDTDYRMRLDFFLGIPDITLTNEGEADSPESQRHIDWQKQHFNASVLLSTQFPPSYVESPEHLLWVRNVAFVLAQITNRATQDEIGLCLPKSYGPNGNAFERNYDAIVYSPGHEPPK